MESNTGMSIGSSGKRSLTTGSTPARTIDASMGASEKLVETKELADLTEELKKTILSQITLEYIRTGDSRVMAETKALASEQYEEYVTGMVEARWRANRAQAKYANLKILAELRRSQEATERMLAR